MWALFTRNFKDRRIVLLIYILSNLALLWMYIGLFPAFKDQSASLEALIKNYPESFIKAFNFDIKSFTTIEGFLAMEQFAFVWPIMMIFMVTGMAGSAIAGEIEKGTIEILLSQPISRAKLFISRYLSALMIVAVFIVTSIYAIMPLASLYNIDFKVNNISTMALLALLFSLAITSFSLMLSAIFYDKGKVFFITGVFLVVMYVLNILSALKESLVDLKYLSFFYYFNPSKALVSGQIDQWAYLVFIGVTVICTLVGFVVFTKRDIR